MTQRENMFALLSGAPFEFVPIWLMGFESEELARRLLSKEGLPENLSSNPEKRDYSWNRLPDTERGKTICFNQITQKCAVGVGWGANFAFGHGGPGEFHFKILEKGGQERTLVCETGCKRLIRHNPYFYKDFDYPLKTAEEIDLLQLPDPRDERRYRGFEQDNRFFQEAGWFTYANVNGFFSGPHYFCVDYQEFLMGLLTAPDATKRLIDLIGGWNLAAAEELLQRGVDCIAICDDLGSATNLLISPELYESLIFPWHRRLAELCHSYSAFMHLHTHGDIRKILPKVLETGVDMLNPFDIYERMDLVAFLEENRGQKTAVPVGGLHKFFFDWEWQDQEEYLTSLFTRAKSVGRFIFMDPGGIPETVNEETFNFLMERLKVLKYT